MIQIERLTRNARKTDAFNESAEETAPNKQNEKSHPMPRPQNLIYSISNYLHEGMQAHIGAH
jgi:hypothetical protein